MKVVNVSEYICLENSEESEDNRIVPADRQWYKKKMKIQETGNTIHMKKDWEKCRPKPVEVHYPAYDILVKKLVGVHTVSLV